MTAREYEMFVRRGVLSEWAIARTKDKEPAQSLPHRYLPTTRLTADLPRRYSRSEVLSERELDEFFAESVQGLWKNYTNDLLSRVRQVQEEALINILRVVLSATTESPSAQSKPIPPGRAYERVRSFLERQEPVRIPLAEAIFKQTYSENAMIRKVVELIDAVEEQIERISETRGNLQSIVSDLFSKNKSIAFSDSGISVTLNDGTDISLARLSSGEKQLLRIMVETIMAGRNPVIVDEPELSMHIDWQRRLLAVMRTLNPEAQIIVATHSPEIMADADLEKVFRL